MRYLILLLFLQGCALVPWLTIEQYNDGLDDLNKNNQKFAEKTGELAKVVDAMAGHHLAEAKSDGGTEEIVTWAKTKGKTEVLIDDFEEISKVTIAKAKPSEGAFMAMINGILDGIMNSPLLSMALMALTGGGGMALKGLSSAKALNTRLKKKGKKHAQSTTVDDIDDDDDFD